MVAYELRLRLRRIIVGVTSNKSLMGSVLLTGILRPWEMRTRRSIQASKVLRGRDVTVLNMKKSH